MLKYRLKFEYKVSKDIIEKRDDKVDIILSEEIPDIVSDNEIKIPKNGEDVLINKKKWEVISSYISFEDEDGITYYTTNIVLKKKIIFKPKKVEDKSIEDFLRDYSVSNPYDQKYPNNWDYKKIFK